jgi:hypothetical protein
VAEGLGVLLYAYIGQLVLSTLATGIVVAHRLRTIHVRVGMADYVSVDCTWDVCPFNCGRRPVSFCPKQVIRTHSSNGGTWLERPMRGICASTDRERTRTHSNPDHVRTVYSSVRSLLKLNEMETLKPGPGSEFLIAHLMELTLVEMLRRETPKVDDRSTGLIAGLLDPTIASGLLAMHGKLRASGA